MKKFFYYLMVVALAIVLAACGPMEESHNNDLGSLLSKFVDVDQLPPECIQADRIESFGISPLLNGPDVVTLGVKDQYQIAVLVPVYSNQPTVYLVMSGVDDYRRKVVEGGQVITFPDECLLDDVRNIANSISAGLRAPVVIISPTQDDIEFPPMNIP